MEEKKIQYKQKITPDISASDALRKIYPEEGRAENFSREVTFQVGEGCTLNCTYCYQKDKSANRVMSFETGKKIVDLLYRMWDENKPGAFINKDTKMIILDFIGGEPMMYVDVMDKIVSYFWQTAIERRHPWAETFMISIATNGTLHFRPEVQNFIYKYKEHLSYGVSIDGPKEMHDACRVYYDGRGSFDDAYAAQEDYNKHFHTSSGTKATIARANLPYLSTLIKYYVGQGYQQIHANYVYEEHWNNEDAKLLYDQMGEISDYILGLDFPVEISLFDDRYFTPMNEDDNRNWCWGKGTPVLTTTGYKPIEDVKIGDLVYTEDGTIHPVINTMSHFADNVVEFVVADKHMTCTDDHKLFVKKYDGCSYREKTKEQVKNISENDLIEFYGGKYYQGLIYKRARPQEVYNITVDENHSYIANGICSSNCGGTGAMVAFDPVGKAYPCIRYMESSLAGDMPGLVIGDTDGIWDERYKEVTDAMNAVTRRSQSTDECFYCPIASGCSWCLKAGTKILTPNGNKNIEELRVGDLVISAENLSRSVTKVFKHYAEDTRLLTFANGAKLYTTDNHPILTLKGNYVAAADLKLGEIIQTTHGCTVLTGSEKQEPYDVYNLTVEQDSSFIANGIKVHNCSGWNYQEQKSFNKRSTNICPMHKARSLASVKHYNKLYLKNGDKKTFHRYLPDEEALKIISQEELDLLNELEEQTKKLAPKGYDQREFRFCSSC